MESERILSLRQMFYKLSLIDDLPCHFQQFMQFVNYVIHDLKLVRIPCQHEQVSDLALRTY